MKALETIIKILGSICMIPLALVIGVLVGLTIIPLEIIELIWD